MIKDCIFDVDDRVILISGRYALSKSNPIYSATGVEGIIIKKWSASNSVRVLWDNGSHNSYRLSDLEIVENPIIDVDELFEDIDI
jgi:hypothetical protein